MVPPDALPADEPKTDRDWLIMISKDLKAVIKKIEGKDGVCDKQKEQEEKIGALQAQIEELKRGRFQQTVLLIFLIILIGGRYVLGPTSIPIVP